MITQKGKVMKLILVAIASVLLMTEAIPERADVLVAALVLVMSIDIIKGQ